MRKPSAQIGGRGFLNEIIPDLKEKVKEKATMGIFSGNDSVRIVDHTDEVLKATRDAAIKALEAVGTQAESHAVKNIKQAGRVDTGRLSGSITHIVEPVEPAVYVGTNVEYAIYNEVGTGIHSSTGNGRKTPWVYKDSEGNFHRTNGMKPIHFLKNAIENNRDEYSRIIKQYLENA